MYSCGWGWSIICLHSVLLLDRHQQCKFWFRRSIRCRRLLGHSLVRRFGRRFRQCCCWRRATSRCYPIRYGNWFRKHRLHSDLCRNSLSFSEPLQYRNDKLIKMHYCHAMLRIIYYLPFRKEAPSKRSGTTNRRTKAAK